MHNKKMFYIENEDQCKFKATEHNMMPFDCKNEIL